MSNLVRLKRMFFVDGMEKKELLGFFFIFDRIFQISKKMFYTSKEYSTVTFL